VGRGETSLETLFSNLQSRYKGRTCNASYEISKSKVRSLARSLEPVLNEASQGVVTHLERTRVRYKKRDLERVAERTAGAEMAIQS